MLVEPLFSFYRQICFGGECFQTRWVGCCLHRLLRKMPLRLQETGHCSLGENLQGEEGRRCDFMTKTSPGFISIKYEDDHFNFFLNLWHRCLY